MTTLSFNNANLFSIYMDMTNLYRAMINLDRILKSRDTTLPTKISIAKAMV